ncbi:uncharacterized protein LAESUDRAFT_726652 [Laetiporus sulphureus 93-53]|uniref:DUF6533 domain-containing protein n=1 Tax=Laetiporus sulphureus 93-53 TaxID=1314785 RepID=A0A165DVL2_9APHY|nr:uncharacterized protein LAESUDRAFT_726652 [Laetiporus sulphureus 93-53]KZT05718.1 hypothetical protein LAESUDRAFT_726652 [Laetiporus sulphureus 93-53]
MSITTSEATAILEEIFPENYAIIAGAALILFDHAITFGQEVQLFWGERSFSAWLFFANRMLALVYASISVWSVMNIYTVASCMANFMASNVVFDLLAVISQVVTMLRVYAVTGGDRRPVMLVALMTVLNVVFDAYTEFAQISYSVVILNRTAICSQSYASSSEKDVVTRLEIASSAFAAVAAIMTLAILWRKLYVDHRPVIADLLSTRNPSLAAQLLRDGTIQLTVLLLLNLLLTVLTFVNSVRCYIYHRIFGILTRSHSDLSCPPQHPSRSAVHARRTIPNTLFRPVAAWSPNTRRRRKHVVRIKRPQQHRTSPAGRSLSPARVY